jgi:iron complex outermembrane receptor protein
MAGGLGGDGRDWLPWAEFNRFQSTTEKCMRRLMVVGGGALLALTAWMNGASAATATAAAATELEEVIVTAERRETNVQKTPMNISVVSGSDIQRQGLNDMEQILNNLPGVSVQGQVRGFNPSIRGLGTDLPPGSSQGTVATEVDSVYDIRAESGRIGYFDLARVEVLAGPQGTLYGVNSDGGVVNIISNNPVLGKTQMSGQLQVGNYNLLRAEGMINIPLGASQSLRIAAASLKRKGYLDTGSSDDNGQGLRIKYFYQPSDALSLLLGFEYNKLGGKGAGSVNQFVDGNASQQYNNGQFVKVPTPWTSATSTFWGPQFSASGIPCFTDACQTDDYSSKKYWANLQWDAGPVNVQFIPSYKINHDTTNACGMGPCSPGADPKFLLQRSQELRISNKTGARITWAFGGYHFDYAQNTIGGPGGPGGVTVSQDSQGIFGDVTVPFGDRVRGRLGARSTRDEKNQSGLPPGVVAPARFTHFDYRAGVEYDLRPQSMLYAIVATGYRPGGFNFPPVANYKNEEVTDLEIGTKNRFMDDRVQFNADFFYYDFKNYQLLDFYTAAGNYCNFFDPRNPPFLFPPTFNLDAKNMGLDLSLAAKLADNDSVNVSMTYLDAKFTSKTRIYYNPIDSCAAFNANPGSPAVQNDQVSVGSYVIDGAPEPRSPKFSTTISWEHKFRFGNGMTLAARPVVHYQTASFVHPVEYNVSNQPAYSTYEFSATLTPSNSEWSIAAWGRNLGNKAIKQSLFPMTLNQPRTFGVTLSARMN